MRTAGVCLLLLLACQERSGVTAPAPSPPGPTTAAPARATAEAGTGGWTEAQEGCVNQWLAAQKLDAYGSPLGTQYMGGTPLFDEVSGHATPRQAFLAAHRPEALRSCGVSP